MFYPQDSYLDCRRRAGSEEAYIARQEEVGRSRSRKRWAGIGAGGGGQEWEQEEEQG